MDRKRLVRQIKAKGITVGSESLKIVRELGSGGNGVAFLCQAKERDPFVAKVYIPPDSRALQYLVGALYGSTENASRFRPSADTATTALAQFPLAERLAAFEAVAKPIRPNQILEMIEGIPKSQTYSIVQTLHERKLILLDWGETVFELLVRIDEPKAWPDIKKAVEDNDIRSIFRVKRYVGHLSQSHQIEFLTKWLEQNTSDGYAVENMIDAVLALELPNTTRLAFLRKLDRKLELLPGSFRNLYPLKQRVATNMNSLQAEIGVSFPESAPEPMSDFL